jgi:hypothetical protein
MLERGPVDVIVGRISVDKSVQDKCVEREAPVLGRWSIDMAFPLPRVFKWIHCLLVGVEIPVNFPGIIRCRDDSECPVSQDTDKYGQHAGKIMEIAYMLEN